MKETALSLLEYLDESLVVSKQNTSLNINLRDNMIQIIWLDYRCQIVPDCVNSLWCYNKGYGEALLVGHDRITGDFIEVGHAVYELIHHSLVTRISRAF